MTTTYEQYAKALDASPEQVRLDTLASQLSQCLTKDELAKVLARHIGDKLILALVTEKLEKLR